jgi:phosphatidylglycerophosphate synthase
MPGDCYAASERGFMDSTRALRASALAPILPLLVRARVRPDHITAVAAVVGGSFALLWPDRPWLAMAALALHVILDGVDGPLARHLKIDSRRGSFTDTMADQLVVTASTLALMVSGHLSAPAGALYLVAYWVVVLFAMARNALEIPYAWLVRPRFFVYLAIPVALLWWPPALELTTWIATVLLVGKCASGFFQLRREL